MKQKYLLNLTANIIYHHSLFHNKINIINNKFKLKGVIYNFNDRKTTNIKTFFTELTDFPFFKYRKWFKKILATLVNNQRTSFTFFFKLFSFSL